MKSVSVCSFVLLAAVISFPCSSVVAEETASASAISRGPDVVFVPTPDEIVNEMLKLADVRSGDRFYDLGSGDGRIVVAAAQNGAISVGVDINPERVAEGRANARKHGVEENARFIEGDLFTTDFRDADVVSLYLLSSLNLKLRPRLLNELKPGTRIVSHSFDMGSWRPDKATAVNATYPNVYLWVVPAKAEGRWLVNTPDGETLQFNLTQEFQDVRGEVLTGGSPVELGSGVVQGEDIRLEYKVGPESYTIVGKLDNDSLNATLNHNGQQTQLSGSRVSRNSDDEKQVARAAQPQPAK